MVNFKWQEVGLKWNFNSHLLIRIETHLRNKMVDQGKEEEARPTPDSDATGKGRTASTDQSRALQSHKVFRCKHQCRLTIGTHGMSHCLLSRPAELKAAIRPDSTSRSMTTKSRTLKPQSSTILQANHTRISNKHSSNRPCSPKTKPTSACNHTTSRASTASSKPPSAHSIRTKNKSWEFNNASRITSFKNRSCSNKTYINYKRNKRR